MHETNFHTFARLYRELGFWVVIKRNLRKISLEYELFSFATDTVRSLLHSRKTMMEDERSDPCWGCMSCCDQVHQQLDMAVVAILSHGENGSIICTNGEKVTFQPVHCANHS